MNKDKSYKIIAKSSALFGGVQFIQVIATVLRGKILAIYLGPIGLGISSIFVTTTTLIQTISTLGLNFSAVREISLAIEKENKIKEAQIIFLLFKFLLISSISICILLTVFAPSVSYYSFGDNSYALEFRWLSSIIFLNALNVGIQTVFQGKRKLKFIAQSTVLSSIFTVIATFPLYYFYGIDGIVPSLILTYIITFLISFYYYKKISLHKIKTKTINLFKDGKEMILLGVAKMSTSLMGNLASFFIIIFIQSEGSLQEVGFYQAGMKIAYQYVGLIFAAIAIDYFPRISAVSEFNFKLNKIANDQSEITLLLVIPILFTLILFAPLLIRIMFSSEFLPITDFIRFCSVGVYFLAAKQSLDLIPFAKGDKSTFIYYTIYGTLSLILFTVLGYYYNGLNGVAILFTIHCFLNLIIISIIIFLKYNFIFSYNFKVFFIVGLIQMLFVLSISFLVKESHLYIYGFVFFILSVLYSTYYLDKLIGLKSLIQEFFNNNK